MKARVQRFMNISVVRRILPSLTQRKIPLRLLIMPTSNATVNTAVKTIYLLILCLPLLPYNNSVLIPAQNL